MVDINKYFPDEGFGHIWDRELPIARIDGEIYLVDSLNRKAYRITKKRLTMHEAVATQVKDSELLKRLIRDFDKTPKQDPTKL